MIRKNCFDLLRIFAALMVIHSHHFGMSFLTAPFFRGWYSYGVIAVMIFFSISGYLISQSFNRSSNYFDFIVKRVKRIFPALVFCSFILVYFISPFFQNDAFQYLISEATLKNFLSMSLMLSKNIPNMWLGYKQELAANPVLWTLPVEFLWYVIIGIALSISNTWKMPATLLAACIAVVSFFPEIIKHMVFYTVPLFWLCSFGICFTIGSLLSLTEESWNKTKTKVLLLFLSVVFLYILKGKPEINTIGFACIAVITIIFGVSYRDELVKGRFDISYGLYIWAWPVQATVTNFTDLGFYLSFIVTVIITGLISLISWKYIESPFLKRRNIAN